MVEQGKTVLKMTLVNSGKRARRNLYSTYRKGRRGILRYAVRGYPGMRRYTHTEPSVSVILPPCGKYFQQLTLLHGLVQRESNFPTQKKLPRESTGFLSLFSFPFFLPIFVSPFLRTKFNQSPHALILHIFVFLHISVRISSTDLIRGKYRARAFAPQIECVEVILRRRRSHLSSIVDCPRRYDASLNGTIISPCDYFLHRDRSGAVTTNFFTLRKIRASGRCAWQRTRDLSIPRDS